MECPGHPYLLSLPNSSLSDYCSLSLSLSLSPSPSPSPLLLTELPVVSSSTSGGAVAGGVLAVIAALVIIGFVVFGIVGYCVYKKRGTANEP